MKPAEKARQLLIDRQRAYQQTFTENEATKAVLADLAEFCRADVSTFHADPRVAAALDGRREVWLRILKYTQLDSTTLFRKHGVL